MLSEAGCPQCLLLEMRSRSISSVRLLNPEFFWQLKYELKQGGLETGNGIFDPSEQEQFWARVFTFFHIVSTRTNNVVLAVRREISQRS